MLDFTYKNKIPEYFCFRVGEEGYSVQDSYFYPEYNMNDRNKIDQFKEDYFKFNKDFSQNTQNFSIFSTNFCEPDKNIIELDETSLLIERHTHFCNE